MLIMRYPNGKDIFKVWQTKYDELNESVKSALANAKDDLTDEKNVELVLFTNTAFNESAKKKIQEISKHELLSSYNVSVHDRNDIDLQKAIEEENSNLITQGDLKLVLGDDKSANKLAYGDGQGIIVNIHASSLLEEALYEKYGRKGLFSYNLREHINQKNVDDAIDDTIAKEKDNFSYYNNGITIGCGDYHICRYKLVRFMIFLLLMEPQTTTKNRKIERYKC